MIAIILFIWKLMMVDKRTPTKQSDKGKPACLGFVYSFEAYMTEKHTVSILPNRQKHDDPPPQLIPMHIHPNRNPRTEWQIWCENNKMLFQSTA
ncbi:hypothetical protein L1N85_06425 [Paenibacillus alkaliterrae]|uniref:hypothetical protein n=1 Tax=Paenibacillus alkaliterrae TaxID=320909 RepID=UPI001F311236|nr:hypothetical protein [Paenibacillus alkaliterrae]MCF2938066.1 hypothetical protein [Paenibacillus alkaliterrae]